VFVFIPEAVDVQKSESASGGWARPHTGRIIGLSLLNHLGIHWFDYLPVIDFDLPPRFQDGTETPFYTHRLNTALAPTDYPRDLGTISKPLKLIVGDADRVFDAGRYAEAILPFVDADITILKGVSHIGVVVDTQTQAVVNAWLKQFSDNL